MARARGTRRSRDCDAGRRGRRRRARRGLRGARARSPSRAAASRRSSRCRCCRQPSERASRAVRRSSRLERRRCCAWAPLAEFFVETRRRRRVVRRGGRRDRARRDARRRAVGTRRARATRLAGRREARAVARAGRARRLSGGRRAASRRCSSGARKDAPPVRSRDRQLPSGFASARGCGGRSRRRGDAGARGGLGMGCARAEIRCARCGSASFGGARRRVRGPCVAPGLRRARCDARWAGVLRVAADRAARSDTAGSARAREAARGRGGGGLARQQRTDGEEGERGFIATCAEVRRAGVARTAVPERA